MDLKITTPVAPNAAHINERDVLALKRALNRLGYYTPPANIGITAIPDRAMFAALQAFQKERGLKQTQTLKADDETITALARELQQNSNAQYVWRSVQDEKVRPGHAALDGQIRILGQGLEPGEDINCRCWMEKGPALYQSGRFPIPENPSNPNLIQASALSVVWNGIRITAAACAANPACRAWAIRNGVKIVLESAYHPPPITLPAFPNAKESKKRGSRKRWVDSKGRIYEWDSQHGEVEIYDKTGKKHQGGFDPKTGKRRSKPDPKKKVEK